MRVEVHSAADFVMNLLRVKHGKDLTDIQLEKFKGSLADIMLIRYQSHWYPEVPTKGSGYRCIRINGKMDPMIEQAGVAVGLQPRILRKMLPAELTMWIDPAEVAYRIGENGSICVLHDTVSRSSPSSDVESTGSEESVGRLDISVIKYLVDGSPNSSKSSPYVNYHHNNNNHHQYHHNNNHNNRYNNRLNSNYNNHHHHNNQQQQQQQNQHLAENSLYHWDGLHSSTNFNSFNSKVRTNC